MSEEQIFVLIPIVSVIATGIVFIAFFYFSFRTRSVFAEKGYSADEIIKIFNTKKNKEENPKTNLTRGAFILIIGIGFIIGRYLSETTKLDFIFASSMIIFTGLAFLVSYYLNKKTN